MNSRLSSSLPWASRVGSTTLKALPNVLRHAVVGGLLAEDLLVLVR